MSSGIPNTLACRLDQLVQMDAARMRISEGTLDQDLRNTKLFGLPTGTDTQRIPFRCVRSLLLTGHFIVIQHIVIPLFVIYLQK